MKKKRKYYLPLLSKPTLRKSIAVLLFMFSFSLQAQIITIGVQNPAASETGPSNGVFSVVSDTPAPFPGLTINYSVSGSATPVDDYAQLLGTVTIPFNTTQAFIVVGSLDDNLVEGDEDVTVTIDSGLGYIPGTPNEATIFIADNDIGTVSLDLNSPPFIPDASEAGPVFGRFRVSLDNPNNSANTVEVFYTLTGTADNPSEAVPDYTLSGGVPMTFANNGTTVARNLNIDPIDDSLVENNETVIITLTGTSDPTLFVIGFPNTATVTIADDDSEISMGAGVTEDEGDSGPTAFVFTVDRIGDVSGAATVTYAVTGSGANAADATDFTGGTLPSGTANFIAGLASTTITVNVNGDLTVEPAETFTVTLSGPSGGATIGTATAIGTITNDDSNTISMGAGVTEDEGDSGPTAFVFTVDRTGDVSGAATVNYAVTGSGANAADATDFTGGTLPSGTANFIAGLASTTITVNVNGDLTVEPAETFTVTLSGPSGGATIGTATAIGTITNDDSNTISMGAGVTEDEGDSGPTAFVFTVDRTGDVSGAATVNYAVTGSGANAADATDFTGGTLPSGTANFIAGLASTTITVNVNGDLTVEPAETFTVTLSGPSGGATIGTATAIGTITNDDSFLASINATDGTATEAGTTNNAVFTVDLGSVNGTGSPVVVNFTRSGTATHITDYANIGTSVSIPDGDQTATITINPVNDLVVEDTETVILTLANGAGYSIGPSDSASANILDNDTAGYSLSTTSLATVENGPNDTFTVVLSAGPTSNVVISVTSGDTSEGTVTPSTLTFTPGNYNVAQPVTVTPVDDLLVDGDQNYDITMSVVDASSDDNFDPLADQTVTVTNADDDSCPTIAPELTDTDVPTEFCDSFSQELDEYTNTTSPSNSELTWSTNSDPQVTADHLPSSIVSTAGTYYGFFYDVLNDCAGPTLEIVLTLNISPSAGTANNASICNTNEGGQATSLDLDDQLAGADTGDWTLTSFPLGASITIGGNNSVNFIGQPLGVYEFTFTTTGAIAPCLDQSEILTITVIDCTLPCDAGNTAPVLNPDVSTNFCDLIDQSLNAFIDSGSIAPAGSILTWSTLSDPLNTNAHLTDAQVANPPNDGSFFAFFYDAVNACASPTLEVEITLNTTPVIIATTGDDLCGPGDVTLTVTGNIPSSVQPPTFNWYDSPSGGNLVGAGSSISFNIPITTSYYVEATANGCTSAREEVTATIYPLPSAGTPSNASACSVSANGPTIVDLDDLITGESAGEWSVTTDPSGTMSIGIGNIVSFENRADGDYVFTYTTTDATSPFCENVSSEVTISVNDCDVDTDLDGLLDGLEITLGTDPNNVDSDGDDIEDGVEVGDDTENPLDEDEDGIIDALDSNILDTDMDGVVDQLDPANTDPCVPDPNNEFCVATVDLEITKTADDDFLNVNEQLTFTITVTNISDIGATLIQVNEVLDDVGFDYISHFTGPGDGVYDEVTGLWDIPMLEPNASATLVILVEAITFGVYVNTATILGSSPADIDLENNEASVEIEVNERSNNICGFLFNQFSPNGDGTNDFLVINCITNPEYANNSLEIYDRYGNQVFSARGYDNTWDGTRNNNDLPKGTYFYVLDLGDESEITKGWIQIIR